MSRYAKAIGLTTDEPEVGEVYGDTALSISGAERTLNTVSTGFSFAGSLDWARD